MAKGADAAVHGDEFSVLVLAVLGEVSEWCAVFFGGDHGVVGGAEPDDDEEGIVGLGLFLDEFEGFGDGDFGGVAIVVFDFAAAAEERVHVEVVGGGQPGIEAEGTGVMGIVGEDGSTGSAEAVEVPFAKVTGAVSLIAKGLGDGFFLEAKRVAVVEDTAAVIGTAGEDGGARG